VCSIDLCDAFPASSRARACAASFVVGLEQPRCLFDHQRRAKLGDKTCPSPVRGGLRALSKFRRRIIAVGEAIDDEADPDDPEAADVELMIQELREAVDAFERLANAKRAGI
jgi:hypothetical protein